MDKEVQFDILPKPESQFNKSYHRNGLYYLAFAYLTAKHQNDCGPLYSIHYGSQTQTFLLFFYEKTYVLIYPHKLDKLIRLCDSCPTSRFAVMPVGIIYRRGVHENVLIRSE